MEHYSFLRAFADSWMLIALVAAFVVAILFVWRPGSRRKQEDAAESIFRNEAHPAAKRDKAGSADTDPHEDQ